MQKIAKFFAKPIFQDQRFLLFLWCFIAMAVSVHLVLLGPYSYENYSLFKRVFVHTIEQSNLYIEDYYYGPVFSLLIAPFTYLPNAIGLPLWVVSGALCLFFAIRNLSVSWLTKVIIYYVCMHEMLITASNAQTNTIIAALIIFSFNAIQRGNNFWAGFFIALGTLFKLYGVVGLAFFFFSKNKTNLILSCIFWSILLFVAPMAISSPEFIVQSYQEWFVALTKKNMQNASSLYQDISVMGMFRRISGHRDLSNLFFLIPGLALFALQYIRFGLYMNLRYRLAILASTLLFVILFSSGSESSGYIIAMLGVAIWYTLQPKPVNRYAIFLLIFALILTSFSPSDLFPSYIRNNYVIPYALKALPCFLVWLILIYQTLTNRACDEPI